MTVTRASRVTLIASRWPKTTIVYALGLASSLASALALLSIRGPLDPLKVLIVSLVCIWMPALTFSIVQSLILRSKIMSLRRSISNVSALLFFVLLASIVSLIAHVLGATISIEEAIIIGVILATSLNTMIIRYMTGSSLAVCGATSLIWPALTLIALNIALGTSLSRIDYVKVPVMLAFMMVPAIVISKSIDKIGEELVGLSAKKIFRAYVMNWLVGAKEDLERLFNHIGVSSEVTCNFLYILGPQNLIKGIVAIPYIHPGPLRNLGSSSLPSDLISVLESNYKATSISFHGFVTHASDITCSSDYRKFLDQVAKSVGKQSIMLLSGFSSPLIRVNVNNLSVGCQVIKGVPMVFVSGEDKGIEDMPEELRLRIEDKVKKVYGVKPILINAHNLYDEHVEVNFNEIEKGVMEAIDLALKASSDDPIEMGISRVDPPHRDGSYGLGNAGIGVLTIGFRGLRYCYIVFDANNANKEFRGAIRSMVKEMGYSDCEVFTTDNHFVVHLRGVRAKRGYHIMGERIKAEDLSEIVREALKRAETSMQEANVAYSELTMRAHVLGSVGYRSIESLVDRAIKTFKRLGASTYGVALMLLITLCALT
ncbi:MAG: DUF2070 family protein [Candidatus Nezhaarchaeota archaeon]|nr:DUF2070 family protein [Candidatus Nezhaarchaeota archaeon]MCX8141418.1 DUF2070 family protein [Candidatus Nezhaarchaeota archaeon]MDW8049684.1 DUF2070 family protein [Nitrososphaerota archaeon]